MVEKIDFIQIYYKCSQFGEIFTFAEPFNYPELDEFFENSIISKLVPASCADKIAVCSWALRQKMTARVPPRQELTAEALQGDFDVLSFTKNSPEHNMLPSLEYWHPGSVEILRKIWDNLGFTMPMYTKFPIYQNAFCARREIYHDYVHNFLKPAMKLMREDEEIRKLCWQNANYTVTTLGIPVDFARIEKFLGVPHYPLHPFLLERCFSLWINDKNLNVKYL